MSEEFENLVRGYGVVLGGLKACSEDICANCIGLEGAITKTSKGLKKLKIDAEKSAISEEGKRDLTIKIENLLKACEEIPLASECSCQKSAGLCKMGAACLVADLMKLVTP